MMIATAIGASTSSEGLPYALDLSQDVDTTAQATWRVNWGDGSSQVVAGNTTRLSHIFAEGSTNPKITTELYRANGQFGGFNAVEVSVGSDGSVFARTSADGLYQLSGETWVQVPGSYRKVSVRNANEIWWLDATGNVSIRNGATNTPVTGRLLKSISVSSDGTVWGVDNANVIVNRVGTSWTTVFGSFVDLEARNGGGAVGVNSLGAIYNRTGTTWTQIPGSLKEVSAGSDGAVLGVNAAGETWKLVGATFIRQYWAPVSQLAVRTQTDIWGVDATGAVVRWDGTTLTKLSITATIPVTVARAASTPGAATYIAPVLNDVNETLSKPQTILLSAVSSVLPLGVFSASPITDTRFRWKFDTTFSSSISRNGLTVSGIGGVATATLTSAVVPGSEDIVEYQVFSNSVWSSTRSLQLISDFDAALPVTASDFVVLNPNASTTIPVLANDFDPDQRSITLVGLQPVSGGATTSAVTVDGVTATVLGSSIQVSTPTGTTPGQRSFVYVVADAANNNFLQRIYVDIVVPVSPSPGFGVGGSGLTKPTIVSSGPNVKPLVLPSSDVSLASSGLPIDLQRRYSTASTVDQGFGLGWTYAFGSRLVWGAPLDILSSSSGSTGFNWIQPSGETEFFAGPIGGTAAATFSNITGQGLTATREQGASFITVSSRFGDKYRYTNEGKLLEIRDRNNNLQTILYDVNGKIASVKETVNGSTERTRLTFTTVGGFIRSITDDKGRTWDYEYNQTVNANTYLTRVLDPVGVVGGERQSTSYRYLTQSTAAGLLEGVIEKNGVIKRYAFNSNNRIQAEYSGVTLLKTYRYDDSTRKREITDGTGVVTIETFDAGGRLIQQDVAGTTLLTLGYDTTGRLISSKSGVLPTEAYTLSATGNIIKTAVDGGFTTFYEYDPTYNQVSKVSTAVSPIASATVGDAIVQQRTIGANGNVANSTDEHGNTTAFTYFASGQLKTQTDPRGVATTTQANDFTTEFAYNADGQVTLKKLSQLTADVAANVIRPTETLTYDAIGNLATSTDAAGITTTFSFDRIGRLLSRSLPASYVGGPLLKNEFVYDVFGRVSAEIDPNGNRTRFEYDARQRVTRKINPDGSDFLTTYDVNSHPLTTTDETGALTRYVYDNQGRLITTILPDGSSRKIEYAANGQQSKITEPNGATTTFTYNAAGQALTKTHSVTGTESWQYNARGHVTMYTDQLGSVTAYTVNSVGRVIQSKVDNLRVDVPTYDSLGNVVSLTSYDISDLVPVPMNLATIDPARIRTVSTTFDASSRVLSTTNAIGGVETTTYDAAGKRLTSTDVRGKTTDYSYDLAGRGYSVTLPAADALQSPIRHRIVTELDPNGNPIRTIDLNGADSVRQTIAQYDVRNRPVRLIRELSGGQVEVTSSVYDAAGRTLGTVDNLGRVTRNRLDIMGRIVQTTVVTDPDGNGPLTPPVRKFKYDAIGNVTQTIDPAGRISDNIFDAAGRLTKTLSPVVETENGQVRFAKLITYNNNGQVLTQTEQIENLSGVVLNTTTLDQRTTTFTYTVQGQLLRSTSRDPDGALGLSAAWLENTYNGFGDTTKRSDNLGRITSFTVDKRGRVTEIKSPDPDGAGPLASPISKTEFDAAGNIVKSIDANNNYISFEYDALGREIKRSVPTASSAPVPAGYTQTQYDILDNPIKSIDPVGNQTDRTFDKIGQLLSTTEPAANAGDARGVFTTTYDGVGNIVSTSAPVPGSNSQVQTTTYTYDSLNRLTTTTSPDPDGTATNLAAPVQKFVYDSYGRRSQSIASFVGASASQERVTSFTFDAIDRPRLTILPDLDGNPATTIFTEIKYNDVTDSRESRDALGNSTIVKFDSLGHVIQEIKPKAILSDLAAPITNYEYDAAGNKARATDTRGGVTLFVYDNLDRLIRETQPAVDGVSPVLNWSYDAVGSLVQSTDALDRTTSRTYDAANRVVTVTYPEATTGVASSAEVEKFTYDVIGNVLSSSRGDNSDTSQESHRTTFIYDKLNRVKKQTSPDPDGTGPLAAVYVEYQYDLLGNRLSSTSVTGAESRITTSDYDALSRPKTVTLPNPDALVNPAAPTRKSTYDNYGNVVLVTDVAGRITTSTYDAWNRQTLIVSPDPDTVGPLLAPSTATVYDNNGNVLSTTDQVGRVTSFTYDNLNRQITQTLPDPDGPAIGATGLLPALVTKSNYDLAGNVTASIKTTTAGATERVTAFVYDALNRIQSQTLPDPDGTGPLTAPVTRYAYDIAGNQTSVKDADNNETITTYDRRNRVNTTQSPDPDGTGPLTPLTANYQYDVFGNLVNQTDQLARVTTFAYDNLDRQTQVTYPDPDGANTGVPAETTKTIYDNRGNLAATVDANNSRTNFTYDNWDRQLTKSLPDPTTGIAASTPTQIWKYDRAGNVIQSTDNGQVTISEYDVLDRLISVTSADPDGAGPLIAPRTRYEFNSAGDQTKRHVRKDSTTELPTISAFDALGRQTSVTDPAGKVTIYTFDAIGNQEKVIDPGNNVTRFAYDNLDRVISETDPLNRQRMFSYDKLGNQIAVTDRNGRTTEFGYDKLNRVTSENWKNGTTTVRTIATTYDSAGLVATIQDPDSTTVFSYDRRGQLTGANRSILGGTAATQQFVYVYDVLGNLDAKTQTVGADTINTDYTVDKRSRVTRVAATGANIRGVAVDYTYTASSQVDTLKRSQSTALGGTPTTFAVYTKFDYDLANRDTGITHKSASSTGTTLVAYTFGYDAASRLTSSSSTLDGASTFTLDNAGQLTAAARTTQATESYQYDAAGNRIGAGVTVGQNNQILQDATYKYEYDLEGNRVKQTTLVSGLPTGVYRTFTYDHRQRLTSVKAFTAAGVLTANTEYRYDVNNQRITRTVDTNGDGSVDISQRFVVDGNTVTAVLNAAAGNAIQNRYLHGTQVDEVLADISSSGLPTFTLADQQNTIRDLVTFDGAISTIANHRKFNSFGNLISQSNAAVDTLFGYTGRELDTQTGLNYYRDRWYDSLAGEFLTPDPLGFAGGDTNLTRYVGNSPNDFTDPTGNSWFSKLFKKVKREVTRVVSQVREAVHDAVDDVKDFAQEHPILAGAIAAATGTWFVAASGGFAGAFANLGALAQRAVGSITTGFTSASSGIGGSFSISVGNFASLSVGAGISGTSAFAGANLSILGLPVWSVGPTVGVFGGVADSVASTMVGNFTDAVSTNVLRGVGQVNVGAFITNVGTQTVRNVAYSQLNQTGLPLVYGVAKQTAAFAGDVYGAFNAVLAPPKPTYAPPATTTADAGAYDPETGLTRLTAPEDAVYLQPQRSIWSESALVQPGIYYQQAGASNRGFVRRAGGAEATGSAAKPGFFQQAYETLSEYSPHRVPLNLAENVGDIVVNQFYFEPAGGSTVAVDGTYQPTIKGNIIPGAVVVPTDDPSYVASLVQQGRISEMAADQAINDIIQGHTARLYVADQENGLHEYLDFRRKAFNVDVVRGVVGGAVLAPVEAAMAPVVAARAGAVANSAARQLNAGAKVVSRIELNPSSLSSLYSVIPNPNLLRLRPDAPSSGNVRIAKNLRQLDLPDEKEIAIAQYLGKESGINVLLRGSNVPGGDATIRLPGATSSLRAEFKTLDAAGTNARKAFERNLNDASKQPGSFPGAVVLDARPIGVSSADATFFINRAIQNVSPRRPNLREVFVITNEGTIRKSL